MTNEQGSPEVGFYWDFMCIVQLIFHPPMNLPHSEATSNRQKVQLERVC